MKITVLTLFKDVFKEYLNSSIIKRAIANHLVEIEIVDFREYSKSKNKQVDDYQYGGGPGMVLMMQPIVDAIKDKGLNAHKILLSPSGKVFNQRIANTYKKKDHIVLISGHYEGFDQRIEHYVDETLSIGDYVLTGGELPALVVIDAITRLLDNVINQKSLVSESFNNYLLDYPVYTKPVDFEGHKVPEILLSGNHQAIINYRLQQQLILTKKNRKDLYQQYQKLKKESQYEKN